MKDRRSIKTKKAIREAFLSLMEEKKLNRITVSEISRRANLGRGTFYLHYNDVYDLYDHIEDELYGELGQLFDESYPNCDPTNLLTFTKNITEYFQKNQDIFLLLVQSDSNGKNLNKLKYFFNKKILQDGLCKNISEFDEVESIFIVSGVVGVLIEWLNNGLIVPQDHISSILYKILLKF
ncbi:TetR/AcrR family transcriptional regulator [Metaclostridioides mangenotii]|uniref:TetR/AcrR family transcriptional regulator n=1 Tax=Metaclostridioides mangenotii TaxID=1540 RepID=UPI0028E6A806|nr:TetR/AcrR family transcriptional regulator [Clostridioides mangenotii]